MVRAPLATFPENSMEKGMAANTTAMRIEEYALSWS